VQQQLSDENIMYQVTDTTAEQKSDRNLTDTLKNIFGI
jgi:hypothetical protein